MHGLFHHRLLRWVALGFLGLSLGTSVARAEFLVALGRTSTAENVLVSFESNSPNATSGGLIVTGVAGTLLDIDYRPATGQLFGLGSTGALYSINASTGVATTVASGLTDATTGNPLALSGGQFAIDFNPTVDRLRILSDTGQNLRVNVTNGVANVDGTLSSTGIVGAAYTNSFAGATSTTLYDLNYANGRFGLFIQNPPNNGTLVGVGDTGILSLSSLVGFDISGATGTAYVATNTRTGTASNGINLATLNLTTGNISSNVALTGLPTDFQVRGLAAPLGAAVPEPGSLALVGLGLAGVSVLARRRSARG